MAKYSIEDSTLTAIADAIRAKDGSAAALTPAGMASAIGAIDTQEDLSPELATQDGLISQIMTALEGKAAGGGAEVDTFTLKIDNQCVSLGLGLTEYSLSVFRDGKIDTEFYNGSPVNQAEFVFENVICNTPIYVGWSGYTSAGLMRDADTKFLAESYINGWFKYTGSAGAVSVLTIFDDD